MDLELKIENQPNYECLPASLSAVFSFYKKSISIDDISKKISKNSTKLHDWIYSAGVFSVEKEFEVKVQTLVPYIFDPSWGGLNKEDLIEKLSRQSEYFIEWRKSIEKQPKQEGVIYDNHFWIGIYESAALMALEFLKKGGYFDLSPISKEGIIQTLESGMPIIFSHNPTLLHGMKRAYNFKPDDIRGFTWGHVAVICGYNNASKTFKIADPEGFFYKGEMQYNIDQDMLLESILRYNGEIIILSEKSKQKK